MLTNYWVPASCTDVNWYLLQQGVPQECEEAEAEKTDLPEIQ